MGKPKEDGIPLLGQADRKFNRLRIRPTLTLPIKKEYESLRYKVLPDDSLDSIALRFAVQKEELKRVNGFFNDADLVTRREVIVPDRRLTSLPSLQQICNISDSDIRSSRASTPDDASSLLARIAKSSSEAAIKVNDITVDLPRTEDELRQATENKLDGMFGDHSPRKLNTRKRYPVRDVVFSFICGVSVIIGLPALIYYNLAVLHIHLEP